MDNQKTNYFTIQLNNKQTSLLSIFYDDFMLDVKSEYEQFRAFANNITIVCYKSGKLVFQGKNVMSEVYTALQIIGINPENINQVDASLSKSKVNKKASIYKDVKIGSDEVGTGDFFGPIIVAAAYISDEKKILLEQFNILDSKQQTDTKILADVPKILEILQDDYAVVTIGNTLYNQKYNSKTYHMNHIKAELHYKALELLSIKCNLKREMAVIDEFVSESNFKNYLNDLHLPPLSLDIKFLQKAESAVMAVALASMIARYEFLMHMNKLSTIVNAKIPLGCGSNVFTFAQDLYEKSGESIFSNIAKLNFSTYEKIKEPKQLSLF